MLSKGFGAAAIWLKLRVDPTVQARPQRAPDRLVFRIRPVYLDDIQVFDPLATGGLAGVTGDLHHPRQDEFQGLDFTLPILRGESPRDIWIRLSSTSTRQIHVEALTVDDLNHHTHRQALLFSGYIGLVLIFALWAAMHWLFSREKTIGTFSLAQITAFIYALCSLGYLRALWPATWPAWLLDQASTVFSITAVSTALLFHVNFIREFAPPKWSHFFQLTMLRLFPLKIGLLLIGWPVLALEINLHEVMWSPFLLLIMALYGQAWNGNQTSQHLLSRPMVLGFYGLLSVLMMMAALTGLGLVKGGEIALYIVQAHGLVSAFLLLLMLQYRSHLMQKRHQTTLISLEKSQLAAHKERQVRLEQTQLLAMLAHEIKTPLATMHMRLEPTAKNSLQIRQSIRDMNNVIDRCLQTTQLSDGKLQASPNAGDLVKLIRDAISACVDPQRVRLMAPDRLELSTDRQLLFIVINNLLENACKYSAPDSPIEVELSWQHHSRLAQLEIRNHPGSAGWPDASKVFEKYYRSPHARRQSGSGLGLHLVHKLTGVLGGQIRYVPDDRYVRFVIDLPNLS